jgi:hypothetical protein
MLGRRVAMPLEIAELLPSGTMLLMPSCERYTLGYLRNSFFKDGNRPNARPPTAKYAINPPRAASAIRERFIANLREMHSSFITSGLAGKPPDLSSGFKNTGDVRWF